MKSAKKTSTAGMMTIQKQSEHLRHLLVNAKFEDALDFIRGNSLLKMKAAESEKAPDFLEGLRLRSMMAEILDYWGDYSYAEEVLDPVAGQCERVVEKLRDEEKATQRTDHEREVLRQRIWILLHTGMAHYRRGDMGKAMMLFELCDVVAESHLLTSSNQSWGTRARIKYGVALILRERTEYSKAIEIFNKSVELAYRSLETQPLKRPSAITQLAIAKSLGLGLAFIHSRMGRPDLAFPLLLAANTILQAMGEKIISVYIELIYANTLRAIGGNTEEVMHDVIERLSRCHQQFKGKGHILYAARAAYSLGLAYVHRSRLDEARPLSEQGKEDLAAAEHLKEDIRRHYEASKDERYKLYELLLASRIYRKSDQLDLAVARATSVIKSAGNDSVKQDALMARGEALDRQGENANAIGDFQEVVKMSDNNPRLRATALLHLVILYARMSQDMEALKCMSEFEKLKCSVTHVHLKSLERQARAAMQLRSGDLVLKMEDDSLNAEKAEERTRKFLLAWAGKRTSKDTEAAKLLDISRQTYYNWLSKHKN
jgi:tetratricopeptide (TPR) repeat protein